METKMFCYQCQETLKNEGCTARGVCGKSPEVANLQYLAIHVCKQVAYWDQEARERGINTIAAPHFIIKTLFATITNANFDAQWFLDQIAAGYTLRAEIQKSLQENDSSNPIEAPEWAISTEKIAADLIPALSLKGKQLDPLAIDDVDIRSLTQLAIIGAKGLAAYLDHALVLGHEDKEIYNFLEDILVDTQNLGLTVGDWVPKILKLGEYGVKGMALLDTANTSTYGNPEPTAVNLSVKAGPAILISGHDLRDLKDLLDQTKDRGVNVYTHGEMLPANAYPAFKEYPNLIGNYGGSWWHQTQEFDSFNGAILMTTNCLVSPKASYRGRIFTTGNVSFEGIPHIGDRQADQPKDFSSVIERALELPGPTQLESGTVMTGFAHNAIFSVADKIVEAVKSGAIRKFVVMAGCDGRQKGRQYFTDVAQNLPTDTVILTAGCAKYRYNKLQLGDIGGIPRVIDAGQCNDSYSLALTALKLAEIFKVEDVNDLPLAFDIAWYEQKAVIVLLALLHLGVKNIRLGPTLPAFLSENVVNVLVENFNIMPTGEVASDIEAMMGD